MMTEYLVGVMASFALQGVGFLLYNNYVERKAEAEEEKEDDEEWKTHIEGMYCELQRTMDSHIDRTKALMDEPEHTPEHTPEHKTTWGRRLHKKDSTKNLCTDWFNRNPDTIRLEE